MARIRFAGRGSASRPSTPSLRSIATPAIILEMKGGEPDLARAVGASIRRASAVERICVGSFYQGSIDTIRAEHPDVVTSASQEEARWTLHRSWVRWPWIGERPYAAFQVPERAGRLRVVTPSFIRQVHQEGQVLQVWVVNARDDIHRLFDWGVDGIISDVPDIAVAARDEWVRPDHDEATNPERRVCRARAHLAVPAAHAVAAPSAAG